MIIWTFRIQKLKIGSLADFEKKSFSSLFLMRKPLSSDQKWFLRPYFPLIGGIFVLKSGLRFLFRALEVSIQKVRKSHFLSWKRGFSFFDGNITLQKLQTSLSLFSTSISECLFLVTEHWTILIASKIFERLFSEKSSTRPFSPSQILIVDSDSILSHPRPKNSCVLNKYMLEKWNCS